MDGSISQHIAQNDEEMYDEQTNREELDKVTSDVNSNEINDEIQDEIQDDEIVQNDQSNNEMDDEEMDRNLNEIKDVGLDRNSVLIDPNDSSEQRDEQACANDELVSDDVQTEELDEPQLEIDKQKIQNHPLFELLGK